MSDPAWGLSGKCKYCARENETPIHMLHCNHNYCSKRLMIFEQWKMCCCGTGTYTYSKLCKRLRGDWMDFGSGFKTNWETYCCWESVKRQQRETLKWMENKQTNSKLVEEEYKLWQAKLSAWCSEHCARSTGYKPEKCITTMGLKRL